MTEGGAPPPAPWLRDALVVAWLIGLINAALIVGQRFLGFPDWSRWAVGIGLVVLASSQLLGGSSKQELIDRGMSQTLDEDAMTRFREGLLREEMNGWLLFVLGSGTLLIAWWIP